MTIKQSDHGIVVDHVESGVRYAISDKNYNVKHHRKVRDLKPGESVLSYKPRSRASLGGEDSQETTTGTNDPAGDQAEPEGREDTDLQADQA